MIQSSEEMAKDILCNNATGTWVMVSEASAMICSRDKAIIDGLIAIFDKHSSYDPHGNDSNAIIKCTDALRADIDKFSRELSE